MLYRTGAQRSCILASALALYFNAWNCGCRQNPQLAEETPRVFIASNHFAFLPSILRLAPCLATPIS